MEEALATLRENGYPMLFLAVLLDQLGIPLPSLPILLAAGALVGLGHMAAPPVLLVILLASLLGDLFWYELGRRKGGGILNFLCRVSLEPETCVRTTEGVFERYGVRCLLFAKFVPGLYTVTPPVAGIVGLPLRRFVFWDTAGIAIWAGVYVGLGFALSHQLESLLMKMEAWGASVFQVVLLVVVLHLAYKFVGRQQFLRRLRIARLTPEELKEKIDGGEEVMIADLRHSSDLSRNPFVIPGALVIAIDQLEQRHSELPRDRDIVLYCT
jgi:membrane protein DedA with SNARE-associated domain